MARHWVTYSTVTTKFLYNLSNLVLVLISLPVVTLMSVLPNSPFLYLSCKSDAVFSPFCWVPKVHDC